MPQPDEPYDPKTASLQASEWFVLLNSGKATARQRQAFGQWLAQSPIHRAAWQQTQSVWEGLGQLSPADLNDLKTTSFLTTTPVAPRYFTAQRVAYGAMALMLIAFFYQQPFWYADYYTGTGESNRIVLADGSAVELDTDSAISVSYNGNHRRLVLHHGEAFFTVAADAARPFEVLAGTVEVQALGTAFDVSREGDDMQATVFEHAVRVSAGGQRVDRLTTGNSISFKGHHLGNITPQNLSAIGSWRQHRLVFEDRKLVDVVKALNRYRKAPIIILGSQAKNLPVTGLFDTQDTDTALQTIEETLAVTIRRLPGGLVLLSAS
jgi:transmembrane sensor